MVRALEISIDLGTEESIGERVRGVTLNPNGAPVIYGHQGGARVGAIVRAGAANDGRRCSRNVGGDHGSRSGNGLSSADDPRRARQTIQSSDRTRRDATKGRRAAEWGKALPHLNLSRHSLLTLATGSVDSSCYREPSAAISWLAAVKPWKAIMCNDEHHGRYETRAILNNASDTCCGRCGR